jgi:tetratricopeptide (TPR) repeat protein
VAGDRLFRELAETAADPAFFGLLVRFYKEVGRVDLLLAYLDQTYAAASPPGRKEGDPKPGEEPTGFAAGERGRRLTVAVKAEPGLTPALVKAATSGGSLTADTWKLLLWLGERDGQLAVLDSLLRGAVRDNPDEMFGHGFWLLARQHRWADALALCDQIDRRPGGRWQQRWNLPYYRAAALAELGRGREALDALQAAEQFAASKFAVKLERIRVLGILDRHPDAARECTEALAEYTAPAEVRQLRIALANAYLGQRQFPKAEAELRAVLEDDPDDALALNNLGYYLADYGRNLDEAEAMVRRAIELHRDEEMRTGGSELDTGTYLDSLGWVLFRRGKLKEARELLEKAGRSLDAASDPVVWDHLGDVCFRLGDKSAAKAAWAKADEQYATTHVGRQHGRRAEVQRKLRLVP